MNTNFKTTTISLALLVASAFGFASQAAYGADTMPAMKMASLDTAPSSKAYESAMATMMKGMKATPTGMPDLDFMQGMMPHHQGAIDMAKVELQFGKDLEIKSLAEGVIKSQEGEIAVMKDWLAKADQTKLPKVPESGKANEDAMSTMMKNMMPSYSGNADVDFVKGMIPHHQGAIDMGKAALQFAKDPTVVKLAQDIVTAQEGEIKFMNDWLKRKGK